MATQPNLVQEVKEKVKVKIQHTDKEGSYTLSNIKLGATDEQLYMTGSAIEMLRRAPVAYISKLVDYEVKLK